jgi:hypothetical protein
MDTNEEGASDLRKEKEKRERGKRKFKRKEKEEGERGKRKIEEKEKD